MATLLMSLTYEKYASNIGKLFLFKAGTFPSRHRAPNAPDKWALVMPMSLHKAGGWWYYNIDILSHPEIFWDGENVNINVSARELITRCLPYEGYEHLFDNQQDNL